MVSDFRVNVLNTRDSGSSDESGFGWIVLMLFQKLFQLFFNKVDHFNVLDHVHFVKEDDDLFDADLSAEEDVLFSLGHGTVSSGDDQDTCIHLSSTGDHIFDVIDVAGTVNVSLIKSPNYQNVAFRFNIIRWLC